MITNPSQWCGGCQQDQPTYEDVRRFVKRTIIVIRCSRCDGALSMDITKHPDDNLPPMTH